jgi:hypothetical protein
VESGGSQQQSFKPRNANNTRRKTWGKTAGQVKYDKLLKISQVLQGKYIRYCCWDGLPVKFEDDLKWRTIPQLLFQREYWDLRKEKYIL